MHSAIGGYGFPTDDPDDTIVRYNDFHRQQAWLVDWAIT